MVAPSAYVALGECEEYAEYTVGCMQGCLTFMTVNKFLERFLTMQRGARKIQTTYK